ncbi:unnamed protein product [Notodromas monacha]|uniref:PDZ domain-containing protein n=1 Tax=Notodromas monacha TaxID=399045 RepID=A0A7R9BGH1_9CRUS|nr:unnamed protein product [Notodromas monacha]CAG0914169.1 unnamed protein product [Notodromas monacha]
MVFGKPWKLRWRFPWCRTNIAAETCSRSKLLIDVEAGREVGGDGKKTRGSRSEERSSGANKPRGAKLNEVKKTLSGGGGGVEPPPQFADMVLSPPQEFSDVTPCTVVIQEPETDSSSTTSSGPSWRRVATTKGATVLSPVMPDVVLVSVPAFNRSKSAGDLPSPVKSDKYKVEEPDDDQDYCYKYLDQATIFKVMLNKTSQGLGLSVMGGVSETEAEAKASKTADKGPSRRKGFIRIKKVYPMTPASECGNLLPGDIVLSANGVELTGLTCSQALEILRTSPRVTVLDVCRLPKTVEEPENPTPAAQRKISSRENLLSPILSPCGKLNFILAPFCMRGEDMQRTVAGAVPASAH